MHLPLEHMTADHLKQLRPCLYVVQNYRFQFEMAIAGKMDCHQNFVRLLVLLV